MRRGREELRRFTRKLLKRDVYFHCLHRGDGFTGVNVSKYGQCITLKMHSSLWVNYDSIKLLPKGGNKSVSSLLTDVIRSASPLGSVVSMGPSLLTVEAGGGQFSHRCP